jgi:hypothetical protein
MSFDLRLILGAVIRFPPRLSASFSVTGCSLRIFYAILNYLIKVGHWILKNRVGSVHMSLIGCCASILGYLIDRESSPNIPNLGVRFIYMSLNLKSSYMS